MDSEFVVDDEVPIMIGRGKHWYAEANAIFDSRRHLSRSKADG
jgi:hypothetical protein